MEVRAWALQRSPRARWPGPARVLSCQGPQLPPPQAALTHTPSSYPFPPPHPTHCPDFTGAFVPALRLGGPAPCREEKGPIVLAARCDTAAPQDFQKCPARQPLCVCGGGGSWGLQSDPSPVPPCDLTATSPAPSNLLPPGKEEGKDSGQSTGKGVGGRRGKEREKEEDVREFPVRETRFCSAAWRAALGPLCLLPGGPSLVSRELVKEGRLRATLDWSTHGEQPTATWPGF